MRCLKTLVEQNRWFMFLQLKERRVDLASYEQARNLERYMNSSTDKVQFFNKFLLNYKLMLGPDWKLPNKRDDDGDLTPSDDVT